MSNVKSMTGFGRAQTEGVLGRFTVEIKALNSRYRELAVSLPRDLSALEYPLRSLIKEEIERGKIDCRVNFEPPPGGTSGVRINEDLIEQYLQRLIVLREKLALPGETSLELLLRLPGVIEEGNGSIDPDAYWTELATVAREALANFHQEREREGASLALHLLAELSDLRARRQSLLGVKDEVVQKYRQRLTDRVAELEGQFGSKLEPGRLELEIAMFADRADVAEELARLEAHFNQFENLLTNPKPKPVGRQLEFLLQEILREVNTIGSKVHDLVAAENTLAMKAAVERIREQIQNLE